VTVVYRGSRHDSFNAFIAAELSESSDEVDDVATNALIS
jgi:hypothetical protein